MENNQSSVVPASSPNQPFVDQPQPVNPKRKLWPFILIGIVLISFSGFGWWFFNQNNQLNKTSLDSNSTVPDTIKLPLVEAGTPFATYQAVSLPVNPQVPAYQVSPAELINLAAIESAEKQPLSESEKTTLINNYSFFRLANLKVEADPNAEVFPGSRVDDMVDLYRDLGGEPAIYDRKPEDTVFVTTDYLLHLYHKLIDKIFQKTEEDKFQPLLKTISQDLFNLAIFTKQSVNDPELLESLDRVAAYFAVPAAILEASYTPVESFDRAETERAKSDDENADTEAVALTKLEPYLIHLPKDLANKVQQEIKYIYQADTLHPSPLYDEYRSAIGLSNPEDYTQYQPRSHYTKNSLLRSYFRAMMWFGRQSFSVKSEALTRDASTIVSLMTIANQSGITPQQNWETIYLPTVFFVGKSDDLTFYEYRASLQSSFGDLTDLNNLTDTQKWSQFYTAVQNLQGPSIMGEAMIGDAVAQKTKSELQALTKGFRFMGQRFIPDSYMFSTLTQGAELPDPVTGQSLPSTPTALMIMTLLGSAPAQTELDQWIAQSAPNSDKVIRQEMDKLDTEFKALTQADWTQNIYWTWLYTLKSLFVPLKDGYPSFMQSPVWEYKNLNTALGSWTELRHDTLLYAKQSYAELGGGGEPPTPPPVPKGYVEPNPQFFERLIALVKMTSDGLTSRDLIHPEYATRLNSFQENLSFLQKIMIAQLENKPISDDDFEKLRKIGYLTSELVYPLAGDIMLEKDARAAIIADVHTDIANGTILYEATGKPKIIYTAIKDINGARLVRGVIYSYYEFNNPLGTRLSDETWQEQIYQSEANLPQPPSWYSKFGP